MSGEPDIPVVPGTITGVRFWTVGDGTGLEHALRSLRGTTWETGGRATAAECPHGDKTCPGHLCICGIHAFHPFSDGFHPEVLSGMWAGTGNWAIWGEVEGWGETEVHACGFRCEFA
ncbi:MAG: hypothetical protein M3Y45_06265, partial [Actinomycetota bacterium]|nr:hypothetical protein [Actinomycetota bacterium]